MFRTRPEVGGRPSLDNRNWSPRHSGRKRVSEAYWAVTKWKQSTGISHRALKSLCASWITWVSTTANVYLVLLQIVQFLGQALSELLNVGRTDGPEEGVGRLKYVSFVDDLLGLDLIVWMSDNSEPDSRQFNCHFLLFQRCYVQVDVRLRWLETKENKT